MNIKRIIREEMDDLSWMDDVVPIMDSIEVIEHFINKPFNIIKLKDNSINNNSDDGIFWIGSSRKNGTEYDICWKHGGLKNCHGYNRHTLVRLFNPEEYTHGVLWKFI